MSSPMIFPGAYGLLTATHLALNFATAAPWNSVTKCLLAPTLIAGTLQKPDCSKQLRIALGCCFLGDLFLELTTSPGDAWFLAGMIAFAVAHLHFLTDLRKRTTRRTFSLAMIPVTALAIVLIIRTWPGLAHDLRLPVAVYAALLGSTAAASIATGDAKVATGGTIFLISDGLILLDTVGDPLTPRKPGFWIMLTYSTAILFLTQGLLSN